MTTPRRRTPRTPLALLVALLLIALPAAAEVAKPYGGETPEAVVERLRSAADDHDVAGVAACLAPDDRAALALTLTTVAGMVIAFAGMGAEMAGGMAEAVTGEELDDEQRRELEERQAAAAVEAEALQKRFEEIVEHYGIEDPVADSSSVMAGGGDPTDNDPAQVLAGVDQVGLIADLMALLESVPGEEESDGTPPMDVPTGELEGLVVEGDRADGRLGDEDVELVRVDGRWYVSLDLETDAD